MTAMKPSARQWIPNPREAETREVCIIVSGELSDSMVA